MFYWYTVPCWYAASVLLFSCTLVQEDPIQELVYAPPMAAAQSHSCGRSWPPAGKGCSDWLPVSLDSFVRQGCWSPDTGAVWVYVCVSHYISGDGTSITWSCPFINIKSLNGSQKTSVKRDQVHVASWLQSWAIECFECAIQGSIKVQQQEALVFTHMDRLSPHWWKVGMWDN